MRIALCFLIVIEILCHGFFKDYCREVPVSWIYIITGLSIGLLPIIRNIHSDLSSTKKQDSISLSLPFILLMSLGVIHYCKEIFTAVQIDYRVADMLPVIDKMSLRFTQGEPVYGIIPEIWDGMQPIYLPAMWLPYSLHHILDIDMRWISVFAMLIGCGLMISSLKKSRYSHIDLSTLGIPLVLLWTMMTVYDYSMISLSQEGIVIGYYLVLCYALMSRAWWLVGLSLGLCLMSRYGLAPWALGLGIYLLLSKKYNILKQVTVGTLVTTIILIISTGTLPHLKMIFGMPQNYLASVQADPGKYLPTIEANLGLAKYFSFEYLGGLHHAQLWISIILPILLFGFYKYYKINTSFNLFALCALKLSLVVFYNLLIIPYSYLFYTSTFVSVAVLSGFILESYKEVEFNSVLVTD